MYMYVRHLGLFSMAKVHAQIGPQYRISEISPYLCLSVSGMEVFKLNFRALSALPKNITK